MQMQAPLADVLCHYPSWQIAGAPGLANSQLLPPNVQDKRPKHKIGSEEAKEFDQVEFSTPTMSEDGNVQDCACAEELAGRSVSTTEQIKPDLECWVLQGKSTTSWCQLCTELRQSFDSLQVL
eukprot:6430357-Amphidinium_carterae.1